MNQAQGAIYQVDEYPGKKQNKTTKKTDLITMTIVLKYWTKIRLRTKLNWKKSDTKHYFIHVYVYGQTISFICKTDYMMCILKGIEIFIFQLLINYLNWCFL